MDQFAQTNDLQQAIENVANGSKPANSDTQFGVPPMPPTNNGAPVDMMFTMAPTPMGGPEMPKVEPLVPAEEGPSAEEILSQSVNATEAPAAEEPNAVESVAEPVVEEASDMGETSVAEPAEDLVGVKQDILRELLPLLDETDKTPEEKFEVYRKALATMHDVKTVEGAYHAASGISDKAEKADALFEIMKVIG
jgi:hypothetical protein